MSAQKIIDSALIRFAQQGYDSTSLSEIAGDVGIRKPSIYAHFKSKTELFMVILAEAFQKEKACINELTSSKANVRETLKNYILQIPERYKADYYLHFWLRGIYLPPTDLEEEIRTYDNQYAHMLDMAITRVLRKAQVDGYITMFPLNVLADAFTGILRGIHAELLYKGREHAEFKALALWNIFGLAFADPQSASGE